uniref:Uncharacterized protein n=1 Tax=Micrurus corallinus TaxID=54390 RepID=A0A2D4F0D7_MICCO
MTMFSFTIVHVNLFLWECVEMVSVCLAISILKCERNENYSCLVPTDFLVSKVNFLRIAATPPIFQPWDHTAFLPILQSRTKFQRHIFSLLQAPVILQLWGWISLVCRLLLQAKPEAPWPRFPILSTATPSVAKRGSPPTR